MRIRSSARREYSLRCGRRLNRLRLDRSVWVERSRVLGISDSLGPSFVLGTPGKPLLAILTHRLRDIDGLSRLRHRRLLFSVGGIVLTFHSLVKRTGFLR